MTTAPMTNSVTKWGRESFLEDMPDAPKTWRLACPPKRTPDPIFIAPPQAQAHCQAPAPESPARPSADAAAPPSPDAPAMVDLPVLRRGVPSRRRRPTPRRVASG